MTLDELKTFCSRDEMRFTLRIPFVTEDGKWVIATDGRLLVAIPVTGQEPAEMIEAGRLVAAGTILEFRHDPAPLAMPEDLPPPETLPKMVDSYYVPVQVGNQVFWNLLLHRIKNLPELKLYNARVPYEPLHFEFTGGFGKLMPLKTD